MRVRIALSCCMSYVLSKALQKYYLPVTLALEIIKIYYPKDKSLISLSSTIWLVVRYGFKVFQIPEIVAKLHVSSQNIT